MKTERPDWWPRCACCGRLAPEDREELQLRNELAKRRAAGKPFSSLEAAHLMARPKTPWGYQIYFPRGVPGTAVVWCTLRCAREFAGAAYLAGYRITSREGRPA